MPPPPLLQEEARRSLNAGYLAREGGPLRGASTASASLIKYYGRAGEWAGSQAANKVSGTIFNGRLQPGGSQQPLADGCYAPNSLDLPNCPCYEPPCTHGCTLQHPATLFLQTFSSPTQPLPQHAPGSTYAITCICAHRP